MSNQVQSENDWETECSKSDDKQHCRCWYDGQPCCRCGAAMDFGDALKALKDTGAPDDTKIARLGWNGKGMWLGLQRPDANMKTAREQREQLAAPEVQVTPAKSKTTPPVTHKQCCASVPRPMDVPMGRGPYQCDCGAAKAASPVGTPQKETPPKDFCDHGNATNALRGECRMTPECIAELNLRFCPACGSSNFDGHDKTCASPKDFTDEGPNSENSVPEGAQGKEPQAFDRKIWEFACDCCRIDDPPRFENGKWAHFYDDGQTIDCTAGRVFAAGEAAGRRSAITEMQEWAKDRIVNEVDEGTSMSTIGYNDAMDDLTSWCAELQEKTK